MAVATSKISEFLPLVFRVAPKCPGFIAEIEIRNAAIDLCTRARVWKHTATFDLTANGQEIPMPDFSPSGADVRAGVASIIRADFAGVKLEPTTFDSDEAMLTGSGGNPAYFFQEQPETISVAPFKAGQISLMMSLRPVYGFDTKTINDNIAEADLKSLPTFLLNNHGETIAHGALANILLSPASQETNPALSGYFRAKFDSEVDAAAYKSMMGQQMSPMRVPPSYL